MSVDSSSCRQGPNKDINRERDRQTDKDLAETDRNKDTYRETLRQTNRQNGPQRARQTSEFGMRLSRKNKEQEKIMMVYNFNDRHEKAGKSMNDPTAFVSPLNGPNRTTDTIDEQCCSICCYGFDSSATNQQQKQKQQQQCMALYSCHPQSSLILLCATLLSVSSASHDSVCQSVCLDYVCLSF